MTATQLLEAATYSPLGYDTAERLAKRAARRFDDNVSDIFEACRVLAANGCTWDDVLAINS